MHCIRQKKSEMTNSIRIHLTLIFGFLACIYARKYFKNDAESVGNITSTAYKYCDAPVAKAPVTFPDSIIGRALSASKFEMYSGYVKISDSPDYLFYWFFSTQDNNPNAPLVIWTNGILSAYLPFDRMDYMFKFI